MSFHPAALLFAWGVLVVLLQPTSVTALALVALIVLPLAVWSARLRTFLLIRRARWLLLSIALLFALATPGQRLPGGLGDIGITQDGLVLAAAYILRLLVMLASLAALHERLGTEGMMAGLYWLLAPIAAWRSLRERVVVRLMLVLEHVENAPAASWREWLSQDRDGPDCLLLSVGGLRGYDWAVLVVLGTLLILAGMRG